MANNLFKNVSAAQIETALAKTLADLIGQDVEEIRRKVAGLDFEAGVTYTNTRVAFAVQAYLPWPNGENKPL